MSDTVDKATQAELLSYATRAGYAEGKLWVVMHYLKALRSIVPASLAKTCHALIEDVDAVIAKYDEENSDV